jgi:3-hydroxy acid dehydrogenase/malonic semialdehyde reductase
MPQLTSMAKNLNGKTILITGASSGIGRSTAFEFARTSPQDLKLILTARRVDRLHEISSKILDEVGDRVKICIKRLDMSKPEEVCELVKGLPEEFRDIDILVNNA